MSQYDYDRARSNIANGGKPENTQGLHWKAKQDADSGAAAARREQEQRKNS
jgi:hypothetical protein